MKIKRNTAPASIWRNPIHFIAFGLGTGASPYAPGTAGTLLGIPLAWLLSGLSGWLYLTSTIALYLFGTAVCAKTAKDIGMHDHPGIVIDEIVGYLITMFLVPVSLWTLATGFLVFRFFDIVKPWPIRELDQKVKGGTGMMIDDVLAGIFSLIVMQLLTTYIASPPFIGGYD